MTELESFQQIYQRASERKGGEAGLEALLSAPLDSTAIKNIGDDRFLAEFTMKIFQSGFVWRVVKNKWPNFERLFFNFDIEKILMMPDEMFEQRAQDPDIIRNFHKVKTIRENALMIDGVRREHGSFGKFVAQWPSDDIIGLWAYLKRCGVRLGGNTGPYALRALGKDTFLLSRDVVAYFMQRNIISGGVNSKRSLNALQESFNQLQQQSARPYQQISQIISFSVGDNYV